jgi:DNA adenine methylase
MTTPRHANQKSGRLINFKQLCDRYADKLKQAKMLNKDYKDVIKEYDSKDTLAYIDPPYMSATRIYKQHDTDPEDVAELIKSMKGKAIVSMDDTPQTRKAFRGLNIHRINHKYTLSKLNGGHKKVKELIITNF